MNVDPHLSTSLGQNQASLLKLNLKVTRFGLQDKSRSIATKLASIPFQNTSILL